MDLVLRWWTRADADALRAAVAESPDLPRQLGDVPLGSVSACASAIEGQLADRRPDSLNLAVALDGRAVGNVGVSAIDRRHDTAWLSYWMTTSLRGQGLTTRALASVAGWAHAELGLVRLELGHRLDNPASCAVATGAGFAPEGVERAKLRYGQERFDVETHARLTGDEQPVRALLPTPRLA